MGVCIVASLVFAIINYVLGPSKPSPMPLLFREAQLPPALTPGMYIVSNLVGLWLSIGLCMFFLKIARGQDASIGEIFQGGRFFLNTLLASILVVLILVAGFFLCVVPFIIFALMFGMFRYFIIDRNADALESLTLSRQFTNGNKVSLFVLFLALLGINIAGLAACCIGFFFTMPFTQLAMAVAYLAMTGQPTAGDAYAYVPQGLSTATASPFQPGMR